ncbi:CHAT domain-containing protein [Mycena rebaudengoi]|nr:CHAT domain-containing protein [Mycena rebaudengoi]
MEDTTILGPAGESDSDGVAADTDRNSGWTSASDEVWALLRQQTQENEAITSLRDALERHAAPHPERGMSLNNLANALQARFEQDNDPKDIDEAVMLHREALEIHAAPHPNQGMSLSNLGLAVQTRFVQWGDPKDLYEAIMLHREALEVHAAPHPYHGSSLHNLGNAVQTRFVQQGDPRDIDEAIMLHREALEIHAAPHLDRGSSLTSLGNAVHTRFEQQGDPKDIDEAIMLHREALEIYAALHLDRGMSLNNLGFAVKRRFEQWGDPKDLDEAVMLHREALEIRAAPHPDRGSSLTNLGNAVQTRFELQGDPKDIDEAILLHREALEIRAAHHPKRGMSLTNLGNAVQTRFERRGDPKDIDEAIMLQKEAVEIYAAPHPARGISLNNLGNAVQTRFAQRGDPKDIDEAVMLHRAALEIHAAPHPNRGMSLNNLGNAVQIRFDQQGDPRDIDEAIMLHREALEIRAAPHPDRGMSLSNLAIAVQTRFAQQGDPKDIDETIMLQREALDMHAAPHPDRSMSLNNLSSTVHTRFEQRGDPKDLDEAIMLQREALEIRAAPHPERDRSLTNLGNAVRSRFEQQRDPRDIDEAIMLHREALEICAAPHPGRGMSLNNLANAVIRRFEQWGDRKDIDEAIMLYRESLEIHAAPHPDQGMSLNNLANAVITREALEIRAAPHPDRGTSLNYLAKAVQIRFEQRSDPEDINEAISLHKQASTYIYSSALHRFSASHQWIRSATRHGHGSSLDAYHTAINLLPQLAAFSLDIKSRQQMLAGEDIVSLTSASATCAIGLNQNNLAVELLEASRSIFWAQALHLRTPVDKLEIVKPELATKLRGLSQQLEQASFRDTSRNILTDTQHRLMSIEAVAAQCRQLNDEWDQTVSAVQKVPGFKDFLRPKSFASLQQAAVFGPIIILLASDSACSALIVKSSGDVQHVELPALKPQILEHYACLPPHSRHQPDLAARLKMYKEGCVNMSPDDIFRRVLADIWQTIVKPVFEVLNLKKSENPPRLWWCPTGPFAFLPIHAAGIYNTDGTDCVSDYVISSNTPTLTALLDPPAPITAFFKMTTVIEPDAPNCDSLPGAELELKKIKSRVPSQWLTSLESTTRDTVMHHLHNSSVIHFACHGIQDFYNPLNSGLILSDGRLDMSQIMRIPMNNHTKNSMKLAFLSACETGKGDAKRPDEAMHLAASLLFAGFGGVIATMWTMNDDDGPKIADKFYEYLFKDCSSDSVSLRMPDLSKAAKALHLAVTALYREPGMTFQRWVPFVHHGL